MCKATAKKIIENSSTTTTNNKQNQSQQSFHQKNLPDKLSIVVLNIYLLRTYRC